MTALGRDSVNIVIGGTSIQVNCRDAVFLDMLTAQYSDFIAPQSASSIQLNVDLERVGIGDNPDEDVSVKRTSDGWKISRGDFNAVYRPATRSGVVRQSPNRHSIDSVIRIVHTLALASEHGFLVHAASAIRNGSSFIFPGRSGAGKTTLSRLTPADALLLSDEVSYVRRSVGGFEAWGTPFTGELAIPGANVSAPLKSLCFLSQASQNRLRPIPEHEALRLLMTNILFFADDAALVSEIFDTAAELVASVPAFHLDFTPDSRAWSPIQ